MKSSFSFGGISSLDFGLTIEKASIAAKPKPRVTKLSIPGSGRDFFYREEGYDNVEISYIVWCLEPKKDRVPDRLGEIMRWLDTDSYVVLSDTYDPEHFRLARCISGLNPELLMRRAAKQEIKFSCDPYRYLWAGKELVTEKSKYYNMGPEIELFNPTGYTSCPVIYVTLSTPEKFTLLKLNGGGEWEITPTTTSVTIDCEAQETWNGNTLANHIKVGKGYPSLGTGSTRFYATSEGDVQKVTEIKIMPRWREL